MPVLGIRTINKAAFEGQSELAPTINYNGVINVENMVGSQTQVTLDVKNDNGEKIGTMSAPFYGVGVISWHSSSDKGRGKQRIWC
ncbi:hypothetical protein ACP8Z6_24150 [Escherichia coli]